RDYPWGNDPSLITDWHIGPVKTPAYDHTDSDPPVYGLYSNATEWTDSVQAPYPNGIPLPRELREMNRHSRVVRGGPHTSDLGAAFVPGADSGPRDRRAVDQDQPHPGLAFRCARSVTPRFLKAP